MLVLINKTSSTVHSSKGFYLFAALWWPVNILEDSKCKVDPLYAGHNADQIMMIMMMVMMEVLAYYLIESSQ